MPASHYLTKLCEINPTARVHLQAQIIGKMPEPSRHQSAQLLRFGLIQKKLAGKATLTMLSPE
jgi:hypothetical protein